MASITLSLADDSGGLFDFVLATPITLVSVRLFTDMVFLDTDERRRFAQSPHEYLIEQLQRHEDNATTGGNNIQITLNHPVKELIWCIKEPNQGFDYFDGDKVSDLIYQQKFLINNNDFQSQRESTYNRCVVPYSVHTGGALQGPTIINYILPQHFGGAYCFTFSLRPDETNHTGSLNFSKIDEAALNMKLSTVPTGTNIVYFAVNYNILRIMSGMGGAEYAN